MTEQYIQKIAYKPLYQLRGLDFDDIYLMYYFGLGFSNCQIAKILGLTMPCLTARKYKIQRNTGVLLWEYDKQKVKMTEEGAALCALVTRSLRVLTDHWARELIIVSKAEPTNEKKPKKIDHDQGYLAGDI